MGSRGQGGELIAQMLAPLAYRRVVVVAAHPDDETVGAGALLARLRDCFLIHITDGAPRDPALWSPSAGATREQYAATRAREAMDALALVGIPSNRISCLGVVDQEAAFRMPIITWSLMQIFEDLAPEVVLVQPYEGGHPDHDASAFAVHAAVRLLEARGQLPPALVEMSSYHGADGRFAYGDFLAGEQVIVTLPLSEEEVARKQEMLACFATQRKVLQQFQPGVGVERFRMAPRYDFTRPPHRGQLHYESLGWPMTGEYFRRLARQALRDLSLEHEERAWR